MARTSAPHRAAPTLRGTWFSTTAKFVAVIVGVGLLAIGGTTYQRAVFSDTTGELQTANEAMVALEQSFMTAGESMFGAMYRFGGDVERYAQARRDYEEARLVVFDAYDHAIEAMEAAAAELAQARDIWVEVDAVVLAAEDEYTDEQLITFFEEQVDPFQATVWQRLEVAGAHVVAAREAGVDAMGARIDAADRLQLLLVPLLAGASLLGLALALLSTRRMTRQVIAPLAAVGRGATAMRDTNVAPEIDVPGSVAEVQELADTINDTAAVLRDHHLALYTEARTDSMTTLPNRDAFTDAMHGLLDDPTRSRVAVLFLDIDDFKTVNDTLGHAAGDELLRIVSQRLRDASRGCDVAARLGGDEFAVALDAGDDQTVASAAAERIRLALSRPAMIDGQEVAVGCSIGIAVSEPQASREDADELLGNADFAMYMAKSQGKGRYELYSPRLHTEVQARMTLGQELTQALQRDQFVLHYQPVVDLATHRMTGIEALIRWQHPTRGLVPPDDFIGLAESSGDIVPIGAWVLDTACATLARLHADAPEFVMGVNVSPRQLTDPAFADDVLRTLERHGVETRHVVLEITEATAMTDTATGLASLATLREHGVHVALDDFGTGYSSLGNLVDLPCDIIKIDRSFVSGSNVHAIAMLTSIVEMSHRLGYLVVAEGIEEPEDLERLRPLGDLYGQGYLFARPMPDDEVTERVLAQAANDRGLART